MDIFYDYIFWIMILALSFHLFEEFYCDWPAWMSNHLGFIITVAQFYSLQIFVLIIFTLFAIFGWMIPVLSLAGAAAFFIDGFFFHFFLSIRKKNLVPGSISACVLLIPLSIIAYFAAFKGGVPLKASSISLLLGFIVASYPIVMVFLGKKRKQKTE